MTDPLGATTQAVLEEAFCYRCHSYPNSATGGVRKTKTGRDYYDAVNMTSTSQGVFDAMQLSSGHKVANYSGIHSPDPTRETRAYIASNKHVQCADCHDPHEGGKGIRHDAGTTTSAGSTTTLNDSTGGWVTNEWAGYAVLIGTTAGQITANTATQLTFAALPAATANGTAYTIGLRNYGGQVSSVTTANVINDSAKAWQTNAWTGWTVILVGGTGAGQKGVVASNTATALTMTANFATAPDLTTVYRITKDPEVISGATGVDATFVTSGFPGACSGNVCGTPTITYNPSSTTAPLIRANAEWQVCAKCHSSANANVASWRSDFTDVAIEFDTKNQSYHPVIGPLPATDPGVNGSSRIQPYRLVGGWRPGDLMSCSDCHNADANAPAAQGPHGSGIHYLLTGTNRAWPYTVANANSGTLFGINNTATNYGTVNGLFCRNCHGNMGGSQGTDASTSNWIHGRFNRSDHSGFYGCAYCHVRVPHGSKVSRLLVTTNAPARYKSGLTPNLSSVTKPASGEFTGSTNFGSSCNTHSGTRAEAW
jgi:hypothetical protein